MTYSTLTVGCQSRKPTTDEKLNVSILCQFFLLHVTYRFYVWIPTQCSGNNFETKAPGTALRTCRLTINRKQSF